MSVIRCNRLTPLHMSYASLSAYFVQDLPKFWPLFIKYCSSDLFIQIEGMNGSATALEEIKPAIETFEGGMIRVHIVHRLLRALIWQIAARIDAILIGMELLCQLFLHLR